MKKILLLILAGFSLYAIADAGCLPSQQELCDYSNGTFYHTDNLLGFGIAGGYSNTNQGANSAYPAVDFNYDFLSTSGLWSSTTGEYQYMLSNSYVSNSNYFAMTKLGYAFQPIQDYWEVIPYVVGGIGNNQLFYNSGSPFNAGLGLRTEVAITTRNSIYADYNYQIILDDGTMASAYDSQNKVSNSSFNQGFGSNIQYLEAGYKYIINCTMGIQTYYRYVQSNADFSVASSHSNVLSNYNQVGFNLFWYMGS